MLQRGIGDVGTIPRQQELESVDSRDGDVQRVNFRIGGKWNLLEQFIGQALGVLGNVENGNVADRIKAFVGGLRITSAAFGENRLRNVKVKSAAMIFPPIKASG